MSAGWFVYILRCADGTLYTGVTTDLARRLAEHNGVGKCQKGAKYTKARRPLSMAYSEAAENRSSAQKREYTLRHLPRLEKQKLTRLSRL